MSLPSIRYVAWAFVRAILAATSFLYGLQAGLADEAASSVGDKGLLVDTPRGRGVLRFMADRPLGQPAPTVRRVLITVHGAQRNVAGYFKAAQRVVALAGWAPTDTMVVAPDFLLKEDVDAFNLPPETLFWTESGWKTGSKAVDPAPISSYTALDALVTYFANRTLYPALREIVIMGHSAGGQVVQRYAVTNQIEDGLKQAGIGVRYVVSNPSSYLYFSDDRPAPDGRFHAADARACPDVARWHYGFEHAPGYVGSRLIYQLERTYVTRNVTYLLGMEDRNANDSQLDTTCSAEAQGPYRLARGLSYFAYLKARHPSGLYHRMVQVPNVGHSESGMYQSPCGLAVLANAPLPASCPHEPR